MNTGITHHLFYEQTDKIFTITLSDKKVIIENGKVGKTKVTEKEFSTAEEAKTNFEKKEWEMLKKGFTLRNENPLTGEPSLHYYVGAGYTGSLAFENTPNGIYIYKHGWFKTASDQKDFLVLIDARGNLKETIELPKILAWDIQFNAATNSMLLDLDHYIFEYEPEHNIFRLLADRGMGTVASFVAVSKEKIAFATNHNFQVRDNGKNILLQQNFDTEIVKGSIPFCATLSKNGKVLALHNKIGEIKVLSTLDGSLLYTIESDFLMIGQMEFTDEDKHLAINEANSGRRMRYFEVVTGTELTYPGLNIPAYSNEVHHFSFNADQSKLALLQRTNAYIFDFKNKVLQHHFKINHCVKTARPKFIGDLLGFRTDYGCFSLYNV
ncbi:hypothetical protein SAMN05428988_4026 [Chitinophaga sp. YR573]|uniref:hypothetical protein n=1 Tax=Chitinophaga sp. YR573 TaxID=1881040 RepID=UPI0008D3A52C|nr:hypothetical protein [Chitinophaga sp. YR573]SEW29069.1 hypothetical protein SAMN05428988_4026 [Chitinophaga sp. YR573]